jgi:flagellar biosynthetic protein FliQ
LNNDTAIHLAVEALMLTLKISMPFLLAGLIVGVLVSLFQAATQIQEQTLTFIPKILAMGAVLFLAGPWMLDSLVGYAHDLYSQIPALAGP